MTSYDVEVECGMELVGLVLSSSQLITRAVGCRPSSIRHCARKGVLHDVHTRWLPDRKHDVAARVQDVNTVQANQIANLQSPNFKCIASHLDHHLAGVAAHFHIRESC